MKLFITTLIVGMLGVALLIASPSVQAQTIPYLDMTVSPTIQTGTPGDSPLWDVHLTNNNPDPAYFIFVGFNDGLGSVPDVSVPAYDLTPFGQQYTLAPNGSLDIHSLFQTVISPLAGDATFDSVAEVTYDLYDSNAFTNPLLSGAIASGDWTLRVQTQPSGVPEPGSLALLIGLGVVGLRAFRRRVR